MGSLKFRPSNDLTLENLDILIRASISIYRWPEWCETTPLETPLRETVAYLSYMKDLVIDVVELKGVLLFFPQFPSVSTFVGDCDEQVTAKQSARYYDTYFLINSDSFLYYQIIFNSFIEFSLS